MAPIKSAPPSTGVEVLGETLHRGSPPSGATPAGSKPKAPTKVLGIAVHRSPTAPKSSTLPFTGLQVDGLLAAAAAALGGGASLLFAGRGRRRRVTR